MKAGVFVCFCVSAEYDDKQLAWSNLHVCENAFFSPLVGQLPDGVVLRVIDDRFLIAKHVDLSLIGLIRGFVQEKIHVVFAAVMIADNGGGGRRDPNILNPARDQLCGSSEGLDECSCIREKRKCCVGDVHADDAGGALFGENNREAGFLRGKDKTKNRSRNAGIIRDDKRLITVSVDDKTVIDQVHAAFREEVGGDDIVVDLRSGKLTDCFGRIAGKTCLERFIAMQQRGLGDGVSRGEADIERMANALLTEYHAGKLGRLSLESPPAD